MKKIIYLILILIFLIIPSTSLASGNWGVNDLEKFLQCYGYDVDFETATYPSGWSVSTINTRLNNSKMFLIIFDMTNGSAVYANEYASSDIDLVLTTEYAGNSSCKLQLASDKEKGYYYQFQGINYQFGIDCDTNTIYKTPGHYTHNNWYESTSGVTHEEFISDAYQKYLIENYGLIFSETTLYSSNNSSIFVPKGGKITSTLTDDTTYKGTIFYGATTETATITYTSGFESSSTYDIFLEEFRLDDDLEYGISDYPVNSTSLGTVTTSDTSISINIKDIMKSSHSVYRLCIGKHNFETTGINDVYICTNWLIINDNTVPKYPNFSSSHYMQFLSLVDYGLDADDPLDTPISGDNITITVLEPYFYNNLSGYYDLSTTTSLNLKVVDDPNDSVDINNYYISLLMMEKVNDSEYKTVGTISFDSSELWLSENYTYPFYNIDLLDFYDFTDSTWIFKAQIYDYNNNLINQTSSFYFSEDIYIPVENPDESILEKISKIPQLIVQGIKEIFSVNSSDYESIYDLFKSKLSFVEDIKESVTSFEDVINGIAPAPTLSIKVGGTKYTEALTLKIIDLNWYIPYKEYGDSILTAFIYLSFLWRTFTHLPSIINGIGGGVEASYEVNDINTYMHTGFGRGDGKRHQNLNRRK